MALAVAREARTGREQGWGTRGHVMGAAHEAQEEDGAKRLLVASWSDSHRASVLRGVRLVASSLVSDSARKRTTSAVRWRARAALAEAAEEDERD